MTVGARVISPEQRRSQQRTVRREAILSAARAVFAARGFEGTTIADVAKEAGVAAGTVYLYFSSKTDLFAGLNARLFEVIGSAIGHAQAPPDLRGGTRARIRAVFAACSEYRDLLRLVFLNPDPRTEVSRRMRREDDLRMRPLVELLRRGMEAGVVRASDPQTLARLVTGVVSVALYQCFVLGNGDDIPSSEDIVTEMIIGGLAPAAATRNAGPPR